MAEFVFNSSIYQILKISGHQSRAALERYLPMRAGLDVVVGYRESKLTIRYENLTTSSVNILHGAIDFLDLKKSASFSEYVKYFFSPIHVVDEFHFGPLVKNLDKVGMWGYE